ncbi:hypothetical protein L9F63_011088, partial [Diploptera punctata]
MARESLENLIFEREEEYDPYFEDELDRRRPRWIKERSEYFENYDDLDFVTHFRLSKPSALSVLDMIENQLEFPTDSGKR